MLINSRISIPRAIKMSYVHFRLISAIYLLTYSGSANIFLEQVGNGKIQGTGSIEPKMAENQTLIPIAAYILNVRLINNEHLSIL
jgi:hypothetical protein